jgi:hypothetical protein
MLLDSKFLSDSIFGSEAKDEDLVKCLCVKEILFLEVFLGDRISRLHDKPGSTPSPW